ncbi:MAG: hypothetical protein P4L69_09675 [Desulfosporosinus sp.]|nr:hypothetical protein [Desulfosporosinus sp.]
MPLLARRFNSSFPANNYRQECLDPNEPATYDYGFRRLVPLLQSPPVGAGILATSFFFLIVFFPNAVFAQISWATIGITVTIGTFGLLTLIVLILFLL